MWPCLKFSRINFIFIFDSPKGAYGVPIQYERSFRWKLGQFRYLCHSNTLPGHVKITISRDNLFEDSFAQVGAIKSSLLLIFDVIVKRKPFFFAGKSLDRSCLWRLDVQDYEEHKYGKRKENKETIMDVCQTRSCSFFFFLSRIY